MSKVPKSLQKEKFLSHPGNKKKECKTIFNDIDLNNFDNIVDVFGGSGWLSLYCKHLKNDLKIYINDKDLNMFKTYELIKSGEFEKILS